MRLLLKLLLPAIAALLIAAYALFAPAETVARATLANGLQVVVVRNSLAPVVTIHVNYLVGSNESPPGFPGTAHAVEHMMFRGSPDLSGDQINTILANMGGESNAFTQQTVTQYISTVPSSDLETMLHLEAGRMRGILAEEEQWRLERGAINQEVAMDLSDNGHQLLESLYGKLFEGTPYTHDALGTADSFNKTSAAMLKQFHQTWYTPNNAVLVITGDVDPTRTMKTVKKLFAGIPSRPLPQRPEIRLKPLNSAEINLESGESYGTAMVAYRLPGIGDRDYAAGQVLAAVLASPRGKLFDLAEQGGVLTATFDSLALPKAAAAYAIATAPAGEKLRPKVTLLKKVIEEYQKEGVPADLVEAVKRHASTDAEAEKNSIAGLAEAWAQALAIDGYASPDEENDAMQKVTVNDVNRVARAWLRNDTAITVLLPASRKGKSVVKARNYKRTSEPFTPKRFNPVRLPAWAQGVSKLPAVLDKPAPFTDIRLANGLRLIVVHNGTGKLVSMSGVIKNNPELQTPPGKEGVDELLDELMSRGGSTSLPRLQFQAALDQIGSSAEIGTSFNMSAQEEHFERGVSLLADALLHPALPEKEFKTLRRQYAELLANQNNSMEWSQTMAFLKSLCPSDDPALRHETPESVNRLTLEDVKNYHAAIFRPDLSTIVITGKIAPARARSIVERYFGAWQATGPKPAVEYQTLAESGPKTLHVTDPDSQQVTAILAHTSKLNRSNPDYFPFLLGMRILSGSSASRLYQHVREKQGLVYDVDAVFEVGKKRSLFEVTYGTDPKNVAKVRRLIEEDIVDIQNRPVSQTELDQAKNLIVRQLAMMGSSSDAVASMLLDLASDGLPLDYPAIAARMVQQVTPQQVQAAFKRWVRLDRLSQVTSGMRPAKGVLSP